MLGEFIRMRRAALGLSVRELADRSGLTESAIYMIERGERRNLQATTLRRLAPALGVPVDKLLSLTETSPPEEDASRTPGVGRTPRKATASTS